MLEVFNPDSPLKSVTLVYKIFGVRVSTICSIEMRKKYFALWKKILGVCLNHISDSPLISVTLVYKIIGVRVSMITRIEKKNSFNLLNEKKFMKFV